MTLTRQRVDLSMQLGQLTERIEVSAVSTPLETDSSDRSQVINEAQLKRCRSMAASTRRSPC